MTRPAPPSPRSTTRRPTHGRARARRLLAAVGAVTSLAILAHPGELRADATVFDEDAGPEAPTIGLIGDSTLAGVRWFGDYGDLQQFNFVMDAESCRRTVGGSCWSREGYRPSTALSELQEDAGRWGDLLVVMSGYNDTQYDFDDGVVAIVEEARRQDIPAVMWLTLRTAHVDYEEPNHQANGDTYGAANDTLFELAASSDGYLHVADWAAHSATRTEWFASDGVHLTERGADALTTFIAEQARTIFDGGTSTPSWRTLAQGATGDEVAEVQQALLSEGISSVTVADGSYGPVTEDAVREFQRAHGLADHGVVDVDTAVALGLAEPAEAPEPEVLEPPARPEPPALNWGAPVATAASDRPADGPSRVAAVGAAGMALVLVLGVIRRSRRADDPSGDAPLDDPAPDGHAADTGSHEHQPAG